MLCNGSIKVKLITALIVGRAILSIEVESGEEGGFQAIFAAEKAHGRSWFEGPVVFANVGERPFLEVSRRSVNAEIGLPLQVSALNRTLMEKLEHRQNR
jgi:hypothetical protein